MTAALAATVGLRANVAQARAEMLSALVDELNQSRVFYCLLSGYENFPQAADSDIDFMVHPAYAPRVVSLLRAVTCRCRAQLVQALQHETGAWYFVLARTVPGGVAYLHPDCTTDYRRDGRLWLRADEVLTSRRRLLNFYVPSVADELLYYLIKKVLKLEFTAEHLHRLRDLYLRSPEDCAERMRRFWPPKTVRAVVSALSENDVWQMHWHLPSLLTELLASPPIERLSARTAQWARECQRRTSRVAHPTGLSIAIRGGDSSQRSELAAALERNLRPAFRSTVVMSEDEATHALWRWKARVRSTLVIRQLPSSPPNLFARDQISFDFSQTSPDADSATTATLQWMARRLQHRLGN